jgi:amphi-Trp domain-containing protein
MSETERESLEFANTVSRAEAAGFLEALAKSLREGSSLFESGDQSLAFQISPQVKMELKAKSSPEDGKGSIEIELKWRSEQQEETPPSLVIVPGALVAPSVED